MSVIYIIASDKVISAVEPNMEGKALTEVLLPNGTPIKAALQALQSIAQSVVNDPTLEPMVIKITIG